MFIPELKTLFVIYSARFNFSLVFPFNFSFIQIFLNSYNEEFLLSRAWNRLCLRNFDFYTPSRQGFMPGIIVCRWVAIYFHFNCISMRAESFLAQQRMYIQDLENLQAGQYNHCAVGHSTPFDKCPLQIRKKSFFFFLIKAFFILDGTENFSVTSPINIIVLY